MNKPYFCRNFFLSDWRHNRLKNTYYFTENTSIDFQKVYFSKMALVMALLNGVDVGNET